LFPCAIPGGGLPCQGEFEAPLDQDESESSFEVTLATQARTRFGKRQPGFSTLAPVRAGNLLPDLATMIPPRPGHRLSNDLLAPLRC